MTTSSETGAPPVDTPEASGPSDAPGSAVSTGDDTSGEARVSTAEPAIVRDPQEAAAVLHRTATWLARGHSARARYVEATLSRWTHVAPEAPAASVFGRVRAGLDGFDSLDADTRAERATALAALTAELLAAVGAPPRPAEPRGVLLPEGATAGLPPRPPPSAPVTAVAEEVASGAVPHAQRRNAQEGSDEPRERRESRRDRERDRRDRRERGDRGDRGDREERRPREDAAAPAAPVVAAPPKEAPKPPPPPPEPRTFPLAHPEATGAPLASLDVFDVAELEALAGLGITTISDLLLQPPAAVERAGERWIPGHSPTGPVILRGVLTRRCTRFLPGVRLEERVLVTDKGGVTCRWYAGMPSELAVLGSGAEVGVVGALEMEDDRPVLLEAEPLGLDGRGGDWLARHDLVGVSDARVRAGLRAALRAHGDSLQDHLPPEIIEKYKLMPLAQAVRDAHFPSNASRKGRSRLGFDELFQVQLGVALLRQRERRERGVATPVSHALLAQAHGQLGWHFTDEQETAFDDVRRDLRRSQPAARVLQGDVGSGKHAVVQAAMLVVAESKHQAVFLAPDALTAEHRFLFAEQFFKSVGIEPMLLLGPPSRAQQEALKKGEALVVYATQALLKDVPAFRRVALVVFEEHGPYGAADVSAFEPQGHRPDLLVFTPVPVPSAIALNIYGQMALTVLQPGAARGVDTVAYTADRREEAYTAAREAIERGEQVVIAFPIVRGQDLLSPSEARRLAEVLSTETFPGARVGIFNGGMSREERFRAYDDFQHRRSEVLLATTYAEHGPVIPNATTMIVEYANQFDLVRLHRLRGHVGHGWRRGTCMLVTTEDATPGAQHNIDLLVRETDGFRVAELDLRERGPEAVLGDRAADAPDFAWADPVHERDLLVRTRTEAMRTLQVDPGLKRRSNRALLHLVRSRFGEEFSADGDGTPNGAPTSGGPPAGAPGGKADAGGGNRRRRRRRGGR
jgi:ATP-dependent DNA helicase RecG